MDKIKKLIDWLQGKKTYAIAIGGGILFALQLAGVPIPSEIWQILGIGGLASLRGSTATVPRKSAAGRSRSGDDLTSPHNAAGRSFGRSPFGATF